MLHATELDPQASLVSQFADPLDETVILIDLFNVAHPDQEAFRQAWATQASFLKKQPGCISLQLHQGLQGSSLFLTYAVFENTAAFAATTRQPESVLLPKNYPDSTNVCSHLFRRLAIPRICVGEVKSQGGYQTKEPQNGLQHIELDPQAPLTSLFADKLDEAVILINVFHVDAADHADFKLAWGQDAAFFERQPGSLTAQLHQGIQGSSMFLNYALFDNAAAFAATMQQPEFGPLRKIYPDSAIAHPHLFRRLTIPGICVGEIKPTTPAH